MAANPEIAAYIRDAAIKRGIDPTVALEVARREALNVFDPNKPDYGGDDRSSFGVFQLHYGGLSRAMPNAGLGDEFTRVTGLDARDPSTWRQQVDFSLDWAKQKGWHDWMGAKAAGITGKMGIDGTPWTPTSSSASGTSIASAFDNTVAPPPIYPNLQQPAYATDSFSSPVGRRISGDQRRSNTPTGAVDGGSDPSAAVLDFASATPEVPQQPQQPQPAIEQSPVGGLAELFKVRDIGQAGAIDPVTQRPVLARSRRTYG